MAVLRGVTGSRIFVKNTGANSALTAANWRYIPIAERIF